MIPGSVLHHISSGVRGPWLRPWTEIFSFPNFPFGLVVNPITVHNFSFLSHLEVPGNFPMLNLWGNLQGPLAPPLDRNFGFSQFFLWFRGKTNHHAKFKLPRPSGSAQTFCSTHTHTFSFIYIDYQKYTFLLVFTFLVFTVLILTCEIILFLLICTVLLTCT